MMKDYRRGKSDKHLCRLLSSMRFRLTLWYMLILTPVLLVFACSIYIVQAHTLDTELMGKLRNSVNQAVAMYTNSGISRPSLSNQSLLSGEGEIVVVFRGQGDPQQMLGSLASSDLAHLQTAASQSSGVHEAYQTYRLVGDPLDRNKAVGDYLFSVTSLKSQGRMVVTLVVGFSKERTEQEEQRLLQLLLIIVPLFLLVSAPGSFWLVVRAMRPVRTISQTVREISESNLSRRLHLKGEDELAELAATFDLMLDRLQSSFDRQRRFTADASHELRTPLTIVAWQVNQLLEERGNPEECEQALSIIQAENGHMTRLVNDLLMLAHADEDQVLLERKDVDLSDMALEVVERLAPFARHKGITFVCGDLPELRVTGDRLYLVQMLTNLVENAIKYTQTSIHLCVVRQERWGRICVRDDGAGIAEEYLPHVFDRFYRVDKVRTHVADVGAGTQGSGLGLSLAQWIAQVHQGKICVQSEVGNGSTFEVWLPLWEGQCEEL